MAFQSQIRQAQVDDLFRKVAKRNYHRYLSYLKLSPARGFISEPITFEFPVTAIIGPNGGGKTTVLGAAACAYKDVKPSRFFAKSGKYDQDMQNWRIEYEVVDKDLKATDIVRRSAAFKSLKWSRDPFNRSVGIFGVSRTVPASEKKELRRCASNKFVVESSQVSIIEQSVVEAVGNVLGKNISQYAKMNVDRRGLVTLLTGRTNSGAMFSEFHFGAGESSIIRMITDIESLPDNSLVLIEEIENGLHPIATIRMVEYLMDVAQRKRIQSVFTTHSNDALTPLPSKAIWSAINYKLVQGKLDIKSLRTITNQIEARLAIFVEDLFTRKWIESILSEDPSLFPEEVAVHEMQGDGTAVKINRNHNQDPTRKYPSICFVDGDSQQQGSPTEGVYRLPGESPETYIYDAILARIDALIGELTVAMHKPFEFQEFVKDKIKEIRLTTMDEHLLFIQLGRAIGFVSEEVVRSAFLVHWNRVCKKEADEIRAVIADSFDPEMREVE
jgi:AAA15 family ATPase/GTPase